jgi:hypothetical protein
MPRTLLSIRPFVIALVSRHVRGLPRGMFDLERVSFASLERAERFAKNHHATVQWGLYAHRDGRIEWLSDHPTREAAEDEADRIEDTQVLPDGLTEMDLIGGET